jgi:phosphosulfolactate synthase
VRGELDKYRKYIDSLGIEMVEVSDGSMALDHKKKCQLITEFAKDYKVLSEVGSKEEGILISPAKWIKMMQAELDAGSWKVIAEARESGTVGIFRGSGEVRSGLVAEIIRKIPLEKVIWEAPLKAQQVWFIKLYGANVNLGNIAPNEVVPLETLRLGLRGDSFHFFLENQG